MKIAVLYVCTGKYIAFWDAFYQSAERHFMRGADQLHYFVFTDQQFPEQNQTNVTRIEQANLGWPDNTLKRYHMFLRIEDQLAKFDYLYFFNANCVFKQDVNQDFLPDSNDQLVVVQHPGQARKPIDQVSYERNSRSLAYIPKGQGSHYVCGGVNGGSSRAFLDLAKTVRRAVDADLREGIVATWHDESHLNRYILEHPYCVRHSGYCYPENWKLNHPMLIELRDKKPLGSAAALRSPGTKLQGESMVTVALFGGLGNQMFQYAVGRTLSKKLGCRLQLDLRHYDQHLAFRYGLGHFNIEAVIGGDRTLPPNRKTDRLRYLRWRYFSTEHRVVREESPGFDPNVFSRHGSLYLHGYWQSPKYFEDMADTIRRDFTWTELPTGQNRELLNRIQAGPSIALHVRRGDYVSNPNANKFHGTCPTDYYRRGVEYILSQRSGSHKVFVFSDDWQWAKANLQTGCETIFVHHNDTFIAHEDLRLMSQCQHQVISNSTFSWWAAWLNPNPEKLIVAPQQWFADAEYKNDDLVPENWHRLKTQLAVETQASAA